MKQTNHTNTFEVYLSRDLMIESLLVQIDRAIYVYQKTRLYPDEYFKLCKSLMRFGVKPERMPLI